MVEKIYLFAPYLVTKIWFNTQQVLPYTKLIVEMCRILQHANQVLNKKFHELLGDFPKKTLNWKLEKVIFSFEIQLFLGVPASHIQLFLGVPDS